MGACFSGGAAAALIMETDGGEDAYHQRYLEDQVLGQGEFGVVTMVHDVSQRNNEQARPYACKLLRKGAVFKDNTLYSAIKPQVLKGEVEILRKLQGNRYCLKLVAIFETPRNLYMVTELCEGGEMMEYVAAQAVDLNTEDVSRIAFQLLSAVDHCAQHGIIHRDIKPENLMFQSLDPGSELRLIDFGSGTINYDFSPGTEEDRHTTFAGSAFYISPELFQRNYTSRTDVWSAGATLYVLVAGYPADELQKAFNLLQKSKRDLHTLPNMPDNMPEVFFVLMNALLEYRHKLRPSARDVLSFDFVKFHGEMQQDDEMGLSLGEIAAAAASTQGPGVGGSRKRAASVSIKGSVGRHNIYMGFKNYERILTTLLATMLSKTELGQLVRILKDRIGQMMMKDSPTLQEAALLAGEAADDHSENGNEVAPIIGDIKEQKLHVVQVNELKMILQRDMKNDKIVEMIEKLPNSELYGGFAYHVALLKDFTPGGDGLIGNSTVGRRRSKSGKRMSQRRRLSGGAALRSNGGGLLTNSNGSNLSTNSFRSVRSARNDSSRNGSRMNRPMSQSIGAGNVFQRSNSFGAK